MAKNDTIAVMATKEEYLHLRIDSDIKQRLATLAKLRGVSVSALVIMTLTERWPQLTNTELVTEVITMDELKQRAKRKS